jgi:rare lipoprotein A
MVALLGLSMTVFGQKPLYATTQDPIIEQIGSLNNALTRKHRPQRPTATRQQLSTVSWYRHGKITASGERFNPMGLTTAHRSLPFGTRIRFINPENGSSVIVTVNDRGPFIRHREFDLSMGSAQLLGIIERGVVNLVFEILE